MQNRLSATKYKVNQMFSNYNLENAFLIFKINRAIKILDKKMDELKSTTNKEELNQINIGMKALMNIIDSDLLKMSHIITQAKNDLTNLAQNILDDKIKKNKFIKFSEEILLDVNPNNYCLKNDMLIDYLKNEINRILGEKNIGYLVLNMKFITETKIQTILYKKS